MRPYRERAIRGGSNGSSSEELEESRRLYQSSFSRSPDVDFALGRSPGDFYVARDELSREGQRIQDGEELLLDALRHERPGQRLRRLRRPRESALRFELAPSSPSSTSQAEAPMIERQSGRSQMPTPPYSSSGNGPGRRSPENDHSRTPPLTVGFAPAFPVGSEDRAEHRGSPSLSEIPRLPRISNPPGQSWTASYPPLHRSRAHDSPSDSDLEENTWDTLLTTMEPDEHLPSASSSFTSATASLSTSESGPSTQSTAPSSIDTLRPTEATAGSTYCPQSPSGSGDEMSDNDDDRAPAPPQALIQRMNRRAAAAASRPHHRLGPSSALGNRTAAGWLRWADSRRHEEERRTREALHMIESERSLSDNLMNDLYGSPLDTNAHLPVILDRSLRSSPRPVDGPVGEGSDPNNQPLSTNASASSTALDQEIRDERAREDEHRRHRFRAWQRARRRGDERRFEAGREDHYFEDLHLQDVQELRRLVSGTSETASGDDLDTMQRVIERMARREDIPDEWWAAVGLQRNL